MVEVIDFAEKRAIKSRENSCHFASLDIFYDENLVPWAGVSNVDQQDIDEDWQRHMSELLRRLAWVSDGMAARSGAERGHPVASVVLYESGAIVVADNDDLVEGKAHIDWISEQFAVAVEEIRSKLESSTSPIGG